MIVIKRDGKEVKFEWNKIALAIGKAYESIGKEFTGEIVSKIGSDINSNILHRDGKTTVESIQDLVVYTLMDYDKEVAESYIKHRRDREMDRKELEELDNKFDEIVDGGSNENSNKPSNLQNVVRDLQAGEINRRKWRRTTPKHIVEAHDKKWIHEHDTDFKGFPNKPNTNCCVFNLEDMLKNGTRINNADIESPKSLMTATTVSNQIVTKIAYEEHGGISINDFNLILAPYAEMSFQKHMGYVCECKNIEYEDSDDVTLDNNPYVECTVYDDAYNLAKKYTKKEIYDAMQSFEYQSNSMSSASQTPFVTIAFSVPTGWASAEIISAYFKVRMKGLGKKGVIAIFPKINYYAVDGYNLKEGDPYFHLTQEASVCISKCFYPDIIHVSKEDWDKGNYISRMG